MVKLRSCVSLPLLILVPGLVGCGTNFRAPVAPETLSPEALYGVGFVGMTSNPLVTATIDPSTGGFSQSTVGSAPSRLTVGIVAVNGQFLYVSSFATGRILGYSLDPNTGATTPLAGSPFSLGIFPSALGTVPHSHLLFAVDAAGIDVFSVDGGTGVPTPIPGSPFPFESAENGNIFGVDALQLAIDPSGKFLYLLGGTSSTVGVLAYAIGTTGALTPIAGAPFPLSGAVGDIAATGSFVYVSHPTVNQIEGFSVNAGTGALTPVQGSPFSVASTPLTLVSAGPFLYVLDGGGIDGYRIDPASGALTVISGSPFIARGGKGNIAIDPLGKYFYVAGNDFVQGYNIDPDTGALTAGSGSIQGLSSALFITVAQLPGT
jgi:6-phosphogluconolactonase